MQMYLEENQVKGNTEFSDLVGDLDFIILN